MIAIQATDWFADNDWRAKSVRPQCNDNDATHPPIPSPISHLHLQLPSSRSTELNAKK